MSSRSTRKAPCTGCTLTATAPRSSWRSASAAGGVCSRGFTLATSRYRRGLWAMTGSRSSTGWMPVAPGLYSANSSAASTPSASSSSSSRTGSGSPAGSNTSRHPESWPNLTAHSSHAGDTVLSLGTCMWASTTARPSIIAAAPGSSGQAAQLGPVPAGGLEVGLHRPGGHVAGHAGPLDGGRDADGQGPRRHLEALGDQGGGGDDRAGPDPGPVQRDRPGADQAPVLHHAAFQVRVVPDHALGPDQRRPVGRAVDDGPVLHRGPRPDLDPAVITAQHRAGPHRGLRADPHPPDDDGVG